jgi:hypothetical protein
MTNKQIDELLALEEQATPGNIEVFEGGNFTDIGKIGYAEAVNRMHISRQSEHGFWASVGRGEGEINQERINAKFLVAARNSIRELAEEVKRLRVEIERLRAIATLSAKRAELDHPHVRKFFSEAASAIRDSIRDTPPGQVRTHFTDDGQIVTVTDRVED